MLLAAYVTVFPGLLFCFTSAGWGLVGWSRAFTVTQFRARLSCGRNARVREARPEV